MRKRSGFVVLVVIALGILETSSEARQRGEYVPGSRYVSARGAALGDAFLPLADDGASALFYNPAAIARLRYPQVEPLNIQLQANSDYLSMTNLRSYKVYSLSSYASELGARPALTPGVGMMVLPNFFMRGIAFGVLFQDRFSANSTNGTVSYRTHYQLVPAIGGGIRLASGVVRIGYSLQWVQKAYGDVSVPANADPLGYNQKLTEGSGLSHNIGFALSFPVEYLPSLNIVGRNILGVRFGSYSVYSFSKATIGTPADEPMTFDASVSIQPKLAAGSFINLVLQWRDLSNTSQMHLLGRLAAGAEFSVKDQFFLRTGWGSGYLNAGLGLRRKSGELSLAWTAEEAGTSYHERQDRRWLIHYQMRVF